MELIEELGFDQSFSFIYSPRPGTPAASLPDATPFAVKQQRLNRLGVHDTPLMWSLAVDEWCNPALAGASLRVTAEGGSRIPGIVLPDASKHPDDPGSCRPRGRPAGVAGLP